MKKVSKVLIAYDGSSCSDAALNDLGLAGLPTASNTSCTAAFRRRSLRLRDVPLKIRVQ